MASTQLDVIIEAQDKTQGTVNKVSSQFASFGGLAKKAAVGIASAGAAMGAFAISAVKASADYEQTRIAFTSMLGSAEKAQDLLTQLTDFATKTPFELKGLEESSKRLLAYGISQKEIIPTLKDLGDISSTVGTEKLPFLITALGQVHAKTVLSGEELKQFTETGINLLPELAKITGKSVQEIAGDTKRMGITYDQVREAIGNLTKEGAVAYNAMSMQSQTLNGQISNLGDAWDKMLRNTGVAFEPWAKGIVGWLTYIVSEKLPVFVSEFSKGMAALTAALPSMETVSGGFKSIGNAAIEAGKKFEEKTRLVEQLKESFGRIWAQMESELLPALKELWVAMQPLMPMFQELALLIGTILIVVLKALIEVITFLITVAVTLITKLVQVATTILTVLKPAIDVIKDVLGGLRDAIQWVIDKFDAMRRAAESALNMARNAASSAGNAAVSSFLGPVGGAVLNAIPHAEGGIVTRAHVGLVGEAGPEAIIPLSKMRSMGFGGGQSINITVNGDVTGEDLIERVGRELTRMVKLSTATV